MGKLTSTRYTTGAFNAALLIMRVGFGAMLMNHGYQKLVNFSTMKTQFMNFLGLGQTTTLALVVFAEFFCALFIILGLFTRLASIPIIISFSVALFKAHNAKIFGEGEMAAMYLVAFLVILIVGPGKASVDGMTGK